MNTTNHGHIAVPPIGLGHSLERSLYIYKTRSIWGKLNNALPGESRANAVHPIRVSRLVLFGRGFF